MSDWIFGNNYFPTLSIETEISTPAAGVYDAMGSDGVARFEWLARDFDVTIDATATFAEGQLFPYSTDTTPAFNVVMPTVTFSASRIGVTDVVDLVENLAAGTDGLFAIYVVSSQISTFTHSYTTEDDDDVVYDSFEFFYTLNVGSFTGVPTIVTWVDGVRKWSIPVFFSVSCHYNETINGGTPTPKVHAVANSSPPTGTVATVGEFSTGNPVDTNNPFGFLRDIYGDAGFLGDTGIGITSANCSVVATSNMTLP